MQVSKKHFPVVGLLSLMLIGVAAGSVYYYQFIVPPSTACGTTPAHRIIFMTAVIQEWPGIGGFRITNTAFLNQTDSPAFDQSLGANLTGVQYKNYQGPSNNKTMEVNIGDTVTLYIKSISTNETGPTPPAHIQYDSAPGHGFDISGAPYTVLNGVLPQGNIPWGTWYTVTFRVTAQGSFLYLCTVPCSDGHGQMTGSFVAGCGG